MRDDLKDADHPGYGETTYSIMGRDGRVWTAAGPDTICYHASASRSGSTFKELVTAPGKPATADGCPVYDVLDVRQRCWAHTMRDAEARALDKIGAGQTDCRDARALKKRLRQLYHTAKAGPYGDPAICGTCARQDMEIAGQHVTKFGKKLAKAAPDLFPFLLHGLFPTNNHAERAMHFAAGQRNARMQICNPRGMWRGGVLWTYIRTWRLRGTSICRGLRRRMAEGTGQFVLSLNAHNPVYTTFK